MGRRRLLALVLGLAAAAIVAIVVAPRIAVFTLQRAIAGATTASAETEALCRANHWVHRGLTPTYAVTTRDERGAEIRPWQDGRYDQVRALTLTWSTGQVVERTLLSSDGLGCVFGE